MTFSSSKSGKQILFYTLIDRYGARLKLVCNIVGGDKVDRHYREQGGRMS